jgi:hypothetical protein
MHGCGIQCNQWCSTIDEVGCKSEPPLSIGVILATLAGAIITIVLLICWVKRECRSWNIFNGSKARYAGYLSAEEDHARK